MNCKLLQGGKDKEVESEVALKSENIPQRSAEDIQQELSVLQGYLDDLLRADLPFNEKIDSIIKLNSLIIPEFFRELTSSMPSTDKSTIATNAIRAIKETGLLVMKKRESELAEDINLNSPKFQLIFAWLMDVINNVLEKQGLNTIQMNNIFNDLSLELAGWEERVLKRLKGVSSKALDEVKNPLVEKIRKINEDSKK